MEVPEAAKPKFEVDYFRGRLILTFRANWARDEVHHLQTLNINA
jgi:hypothetical protein